MRVHQRIAVVAALLCSGVGFGQGVGVSAQPGKTAPPAGIPGGVSTAAPVPSGVPTKAPVPGGIPAGLPTTVGTVPAPVGVPGGPASGLGGRPTLPPGTSIGVAQPAPDSARGMLWPGESSTFENVTLTWDATGAELGRLKVKGPKTTLPDFNPPLRRVEGPKGEAWKLAVDRPLFVYVDDVYLEITGQVAGPVANLVYTALRQPSQREFDAAPRRRDCYVSSVCPITLNQWKLTLSDRPAKFPDGAEYFMLTALDTATRTELTLPCVRGATRRFGRFDVTVWDICQPMRSAALRVAVKPDYAIRGGDMWLDQVGELFPTGDETYAAYFERLSKRYGFEVKWIENPKYPGAAELVNKTKQETAAFNHAGTTKEEGHIIKETLGGLLRLNEVQLSWKDPTHLEVSPDYARLAAEEKAENLRAAWEDRFRDESRFATQVFQLKYMTAAMASNLANPVLGTYYLLGKPVGRGEQVRYRIAKVRPEGSNLVGRGDESILMTAIERCVPDARTNALVVMAAPESMKEIEQLLVKLDTGMGEEERAPAPVGRYRIEVVLLQGGRAGERIVDTSRATKLSFAVAGVVKELPAQTGMKVKANELLARLDSIDLELRMRQAEIDLAQAEAQLRAAKEECDRADAHFKQGVLTQSEAEKARYSQEAAKANLETNRLALQGARLKLNDCELHAPTTGTIATVNINANERVEPGQVVAALIPQAKTGGAEGTAGTFDARVAERHGISPEDLKVFGFDGVAELGKGLVLLSPEREVAGQALVSLTESYRCQLQFQDLRPPYLIVKGTLLGAQSDKPLLENTLFLEKDKPTVLGLTNLRQALILVLRLHDTPSGAGASGRDVFGRSRRSASEAPAVNLMPGAVAPKAASESRVEPSSGLSMEPGAAPAVDRRKSGPPPSSTPRPPYKVLPEQPLVR